MQVNQRIAKAMSHPMRVRIVNILRTREASPNELATELGEGLSQVSYHVKVLRDFGYVELTREEPRRGAVEHYYRVNRTIDAMAFGQRLLEECHKDDRGTIKFTGFDFNPSEGCLVRFNEGPLFRLVRVEAEDERVR